MIVHLYPSQAQGVVPAPPSKSVAHRAVLCAGLARGQSTLYNLALNRDITATMEGVRRLCADIRMEPDRVVVDGIGGFKTIQQPIDCGESGSTLRFFVPLFSLTGQIVRFVGHGRLMQRPQQVYKDLFQSQNLRFAQDDEGLTIGGALSAGTYTLPGDVSSQFISGLLFALPLLQHSSTIQIKPPFESRSYVDLTLNTLRTFGVQAAWSQQEENTLLVPGGQHYHSREYTVEGDFSQAAFFAVLGALKGNLSISGLRMDSLQGDRAILDVLKRCGAHFAYEGDTVLFSAGALHAPAKPIDLADCPDLGPILMVLACFCKGKTVITNARRLRMKESDRVEAMQQELKKLGGKVKSDENTITINGGALHVPKTALQGHNDHRVVMSLAVAALAADLEVDLADAQAVNKSWPDFFEVLRVLGVQLDEKEEK